ncbi:hypothetical protein OROMI_014795 [Orobanche minor]
MFRPLKPKEKSAQEQKGDEDLQFCWGLRKGAYTFYESFTLDDVKYTLYECVYMWRDGQSEPDIGKLVRIWETESHEKKVEVVWFFRPIEIVNWLGDIKPLQREIFLACGHGKGLSNLAPLEAISGKCNIVCSSKIKGNPQPTEEELRMADYIFYRTFDVGKCIISEKFPSSICGIEVDHFFNMRKDSKPSVIAKSKAHLRVKIEETPVSVLAESKAHLRVKIEETPISVLAESKAHLKVKIEETPVRAIKHDQTARLEKVAYRCRVPDIPTSRQINSSAKDGPSATAKVKYSEPFFPSGASDDNPLKKRKLIVRLGPRDVARPCPPSRDFGHEKRLSAKDSCIEKKDMYTRVSLDEKARKFAEKGVGEKQHMNLTINYKYMEVTRKPGMDSSKWFKLEVWDEERLREVNEKGTLVLLENLDPTFTSADVEDIIWCVFEQKVKAKMVQHTTFSNPYYGKAFAIFKTKEAADHFLSQLTNGCLVLGDKRFLVNLYPHFDYSGDFGGLRFRGFYSSHIGEVFHLPIVGRRRFLSKDGVSGGFVGHLTVNRAMHWRQREEMKNAVATSHFSQSNTIEYALALQWRLLQEKAELWWTALHEL